MPSADVCLITCCTKRKRLSAGGPMQRVPSPGESLPAFARRWTEAIESATCTVPARDLYVGRGFSEIRAVADRVGAEILIVSAGLGLIEGSAMVPSYNLTVAEGTGSLLPWLRQRQMRPQAWWAALSQSRGNPAPLAAAIRARSDQKVLVSLPSTYLEFVEHDLATISAAEARDMRILTSVRGGQLVPEHLRRYVMPYDERLEGTAFAGTQADFPQRALRHFTNHVLATESTLEGDKANVLMEMRGATRPISPIRIKQTDEQIEAILRTCWEQRQGGSAALLRHLRDEALVQCEQSRFRTIWKRVGKEYAA